jgi:uncharacterized protein (UPF0332 family)
MNLKQLLDQGKLRPHKTSKKEINNLMGLAKRDITDAKAHGISADRRFAIAYNAILQLSTILLYCKGYRPEGTGYHFTVFQAMKEIMGTGYYKLADYFDSCRAKRNITDYGYVGGISELEVEELIKEAEGFLKVIVNWLKTNYPIFL